MEKAPRYHTAHIVMEYSNGLLKLPLLKKLQMAWDGTQNFYKEILRKSEIGWSWSILN